MAVGDFFRTSALISVLLLGPEFVSEVAAKRVHPAAPPVAAGAASTGAPQLPMGPWPTSDEVAGLAVKHSSVLQQLYERRDLRPAWVMQRDGHARLTDAGRTLVEILRKTPAEHGLEKGFDVSVPAGSRLTGDGLKTELALSDALVEYALAMGNGARAEEQGARDAELADVLGPFFHRPEEIAQLEEAVEPSHAQYTALLEVYQWYRAHGEAEEVEPLAKELLHFDGTTLQRQMEPVAQRLRTLGYWVGSASSWGEHVVLSLRAFQRAHALEETGVLNAKTLTALNVPMAQRRARIERSLAKWREVRVDRDPRYVVVNIPDLHGEAWEKGKRTLRFKVIVGAGEKVYDPALRKRVYQGETPRFSDAIEKLEFNPYWWIPDGIVEKELAPVQERDSTFYKRRGYEWGKTSQGAVHLRQRPGPNNALGRVKFLFPNKHAVYLHDTNQPELFEKDKRNLSHGCVRVEKPIELAKHLLVGDGQLPAAHADEMIEEILEQKKMKAVELRKPVPVHLVYIPVRVDADGMAHFLPDPYGLHKKMW